MASQGRVAEVHMDEDDEDDEDDEEEVVMEVSEPCRGGMACEGKEALPALEDVA